MNLMSSVNSHLRFSIVVLETLKFEWQCSQYIELNPTCAIVTGQVSVLTYIRRTNVAFAHCTTKSNATNQKIVYKLQVH